ncbi:DUF3176 domain protein [Metarhizium robertsii]|uniref:DUF3176 domain protein n=2 Tax=Metarhizium robertsii TaxID=568076 RepID=E9F6V7_METRA|nr:uncharacterized protein MAA_08006 [Metarhizium robertsii ARSEF 23]EFY96509.1 hypothetical protein MAA_08006 [Metarhizium robertsii ARSEF 23]EXU98133.1 DUF3176 domain protein [Metarhizium robertsii]
MEDQQGEHESRLGQPPRPDSDDNLRAISDVSRDGFHPPHNLESEESLSLAQGNPTPSSPLPVAVTITELQGQGQLVDSDADGSAEREPFLGPLDSQNSGPEPQTRLENSLNGTFLAALSSSPRIADKDHVVLQSLRRDEAATPKATRPKVKPFWKVWMLEMACILLSFSTFILIVMVLSKFDQQSVPDWPLKVTLNTMLSFFVTLTKAGFMFPVSIAISRAQWSWFLQERPLYDFHVLDQASRGAWGSLVLLWHIRCSHFIALGAILMVVSTLTSPVTQLAINYAVRDVAASGEANTFAVRTIMSPQDLIGWATHKSASITTVGDSIDTTGFILPVSPFGAFCSTGNCTFDRFQSLGICMEMANISSYLHIQEFKDPGPLQMSLLGIPNGSDIFPGETIWKASLPGDYKMIHQGKLEVLTDILTGHDSFGFQNNGTLLRTRIASLVLIYTVPVIDNITSDDPYLADLEGFAKWMPADPEIQHEALEVIFYLCVQSYETSFRKGVETTSLVGSLAKPLEQETHFFLDVNCTSRLKETKTSQSCGSNKSRGNDTIRLESPVQAHRGLNSSEGDFSANYGSMEDMATEIKRSLTGGVRLLYDPRYYPDPDTWTIGADFVGSSLAGVFFEPSNIINQTRRNACVQNLYMNFATTLSSTLRAVTPRRYTINAYNITGKAWKEESYVYITWGWISFLAMELITATGFLTLLIVTEGRLASSQVSSPEDRLVFQDIKDSSWAVLVALNKECHGAAGGGIQPMDELKKTARSLRVKLKGNQVVPQEGTAEMPSRGD